MKLTATIKLQATPQQADALRRTLEVANVACDYASQRAWETETFAQSPLHRLVYHDIRGRFPLAAQVVVRLITKVSDAYRLDRSVRRTFRPHGAVSYDNRILRYLKEDRVSIWTVDGRQTIPYVCGPRQQELLARQRGESDLGLIDGEFYLFVTCDWDEPTPAEVTEFLGVDLGIVNIAADSDGNVYSGGQLSGLRHRHARLRKKLQSKGTRAARRLLVRRKRKESRFSHHVNHCISKALVLRAKDTGRGIALEELKGIHSRTTVGKAHRRQHPSWAFFDPRRKIEYKARLRGVALLAVDPRYTSQTCPACSSVSRQNRPSQALFSCVSCGFSGPADTIAAGVIARRAAINWPDCSPAALRQGAGQSRLL